MLTRISRLYMRRRFHTMSKEREEGTRANETRKRVLKIHSKKKKDKKKKKKKTKKTTVPG